MKFTTAQQIFEKEGSRKGLPAWTYHNDELTDVEMEKVFLRHWLFVGHVCDIPRPGDYQCLNMGDERAVVVRDQQGEVRAYHNLCSHRASRVVPDEKGHCGKSIICPFHGWSYGLDGKLVNIPRAQAFPDQDKDNLGLQSLDCEVWQGLIFIRFGGDGPAIHELFGEAEEEISMYNIEGMQRLDEPYRYDFELDWKAVLDIDNEGYHVPIGHPELFDLVGASYTDQRLESGLSRAFGSFKDRKPKTETVRKYVETLPESTYLPESHQHQWIYWGVFPGIVITLFPDQVEVYQIYPTGHQKSVMAGVAYALPDSRPEMQAARQLNRDINMFVGDEDVRLVKWAAAGMRSKAFKEVILSDLELGVAAFQNQLRDTIPVTSLPEEPEAGSLRQVNKTMQEQHDLLASL